MKCRFDVDGLCRGKYEGFGCIKDKCTVYSQRCEFLVDSSYCLKYGRFKCVEGGECDTVREYIEAIKKNESADA